MGRGRLDVRVEADDSRRKNGENSDEDGSDRKEETRDEKWKENEGIMDRKRQSKTGWKGYSMKRVEETAGGGVTKGEKKCGTSKEERKSYL